MIALVVRHPESFILKNMCKVVRSADRWWLLDDALIVAHLVKGSAAEALAG